MLLDMVVKDEEEGREGGREGMFHEGDALVIFLFFSTIKIPHLEIPQIGPHTALRSVCQQSQINII